MAGANPPSSGHGLAASQAPGLSGLETVARPDEAGRDHRRHGRQRRTFLPSNGVRSSLPTTASWREMAQRRPLAVRLSGLTVMPHIVHSL